MEFRPDNLDKVVPKYLVVKFSKKGSLNYHLIIHLSENPHVCEICNKGYIN